MISWDALTPDPDYRRRQQDLGLRRAVVSFNDRAVPGLGNLWFSMPVAWALLGLKIAADRNLNAVTVTNAIEALAMKAAHSASSGAVDKAVGSRLRGHRKLALVDDLSYASLSRRGAYVSQPLRQMLQQPLVGLGLATGGRFATLELASDVLTLLEGKPLKELLDALDAWVGGKGSGKKPPVADSISPLVSVPRPLAIKLRSRLFEEGRPEDLARRRSVRDANWLDETRADARVFAKATPRAPFDAEHWRDLRAGSALFALRHKALLLLRNIEGALLDARQAGLPVRLATKEAVARFAAQIEDLGRDAVTMAPMIEPADEKDSLAFLRLLLSADHGTVVRGLVMRDGTVLRLDGDHILPGPVGDDLRPPSAPPEEDQEDEQPDLGRLHAMRMLAAELDAAIGSGGAACKAPRP
jgi:hypothetical protein